MTGSKAIEKQPLLIWGGIVLALVGFALSLYATIHHLELKASGVTDAACNINSAFNCDDIARSKYSELFSIPLGVFGVGYFLGLVLLLAVGFFKDEYHHDNIQTYGIFAAAGVVVSVILGIIAATAIGVGCPTCIGVYIVCFLQLGLVFIHRAHIPTDFSIKSFSNGATYPLIVTAFALIIFSFMKPAPTNFTRDDPQTLDNMTKGASMAPKAEQIPLSKSAFSGLGEDYRSGGDNAKVIINEFADFECPACRGAYQTLKRIKQQFGDQVLVVFRNYPLDNSCNPAMQRSLHQYACEAAILARCAGRYGKFWPMHDKIFDNQSKINSATLASWAKELGLTDPQIAECKESKDILQKIQDDLKVGTRVGVQGTPSIFINGRQVTGGRDFDSLRETIFSMLNDEN